MMVVVLFFLLLIIGALVAVLLLRKCDQKTESSEIETMYDYTPGVPPPKAIPNTQSGQMSGNSNWSFLWG